MGNLRCVESGCWGDWGVVEFRVFGKLGCWGVRECEEVVCVGVEVVMLECGDSECWGLGFRVLV
jgi:hypothetical protein